MALKEQIDRSKNQGRRPADRNTSPRPESLRDSVRPAPLRPSGAVTPSIPRDDTDDLLGNIDDLASPATAPSGITPKQNDKNHDVYDKPGNEPKSDPKKSLSPDELAQREAEPEEEEDDADNEEDQRVPQHPKGSQRVRKWRKRSIVTTMVFGFLFGGGLGSFFIIKGPLQLLQLGGLFDGLAGRNEYSARSRMRRFMTEQPVRCRISACTEIGETRVTWAGSKIFQSALGQLEQAGITFERRTNLDSRPTAMNIDSALNPDFKNPATIEAKRAAIANHFGIDIDRVEITSAIEGRFRINMENLGIGAMRSLTSTALRALESNSIISAIRRRAFAKFFGLPSLFRPTKRATAAAEAGLATRFNRRNVEGERLRAQAEATEAALPSRFRTAIEDVRSNISPSAARNINRALLATDVLCAVHTVARAIPLVNYAAIVIPSVIAATDKMAVKGGIQSGNTSLGQTAAVAESLTNEEGQSVWAAMSLNALMYGGAGTGIDIDNDLKQAFTDFTTGNALADFLADNGITNAACSVPGLILLTIADVALTVVTFGSWSAAKGAAVGGSTIASIGAFTFVQNRAIDTFTRNPIEAFTGAQGGNLLAYGARYGSNLNAIAMGGIPLSATETSLWEKQQQQQQLEEFQNKNLFARMFDFSEPRSLAASAVRSSNDSPKRLVANTASGLANGGKLFSGFFSALTSKVSAQAEEPYNWEFPLYSVPQYILDSDEYANPYENAEIVGDILNTDRGQDYIDKARACFGVGIVRLGMGGQINGQPRVERWSVVPIESVNPTEDSYTQENCGNLEDPDWARFTVFVFDASLITLIQCYEGDQESCDLMIYGLPEEEDPGPTPTNPGDCPDTELRLTQDYVDANIEPQITTVEDTEVHNCIAEQFGRMVAAARSDGVDITGGGGYRSLSRQIELRRGHCGSSDYAIYEMPSGQCSPPTARPGRSQHERGLAIDFQNCSSRGTACYQWLAANAAPFGFINLESEPWHWSTTGS